jgi:hypothetical protein
MIMVTDIKKQRLTPFWALLLLLLPLPAFAQSGAGEESWEEEFEEIMVELEGITVTLSCDDPATGKTPGLSTARSPSGNKNSPPGWASP